MNSRSSLPLLLLRRARTPRPPRRFLASRAPLSSARLQTLNDKECQRLRNADVSVSKPFPLSRPNSFDGNRHFLDWRITNRFGEFFFRKFLDDKMYIFAITEGLTIQESWRFFLDRDCRVEGSLLICWIFWRNFLDDRIWEMYDKQQFFWFDSMRLQDYGIKN